MPGFELFGREERDAAASVFDSNNGILFAHGFVAQRRGIFRVRDFERAAAEHFRCQYAQATSSGSAALWCAMRALGVGPGDEVITQAFTFVATVEAILLTGATPVIVDVDDTLNMSAAAAAHAVTPRTKLIVPVHMAGVAARMDEILAIARQHGIAVLEDAAQAAGASYCGRALGTIGAAGVISLDFGKMFTCGEGGLVLTSEERLFERVRSLHDHGHRYDTSVPRGRDPHDGWGFNFRMTELQSAVALAQLRKLTSIVELHRAYKSRLKSELVATGLPIEFRTLPDPDGDNGDTLFFFVESSMIADSIVASLNRAGVGTKNVPDAIDWHFAGRWDHLFAKEIAAGAFATTATLLARTVSIPVWARPSDDLLRRTVDAVRQGFTALATHR